jgi:hypothetical protein
MKPIANLYSGPADLLDKARRDRDALRDAATSGDETILQDKLFDFSVTAYHIVDWMKSFHPELEVATYTWLNSEPSLQACRDIANSHKHHALDVAHGAYRRFPPVVEHLDYSLGAVASVQMSADVLGAESSEELGGRPQRHLKVQFVSGPRSRVEEIADDAVAAWERFFALHGI